jgi:hypothetical protein
MPFVQTIPEQTWAEKMRRGVLKKVQRVHCGWQLENLMLAM